MLNISRRDSGLRVITLTSDFGQADWYVGAMKGVILSIAPDVMLVDISHEIRPHDIRQAAFILYAAVPCFPPGSIHLVVVDPGVGGARRPVAVRTGGPALFVAPDTGVLSYVLAAAHDPPALAVVLNDPHFHRQPVSRTFHGRDIFAPAAAHLARGLPLESLGDPIADLVTFPVPAPLPRPGGGWQGHVLHIDRFGNLILDVREEDLGAAAEGVVVEVAGRRIVGLARAYAEAAPGELLAYVGSTRGHLEVAIREGNAAESLGLAVGDGVALYY
jgi:S-adenosylmethionine hydrolase